MGKAQLERAPVIVVTGANGGVGFGICQRLLSQLCQLNPPDSLPQAFSSLSSTSPSTPDDDRPPAGYEGLTLIMACRNTRRAEAAKAKLLSWFGGYLADMAKGKVREGAKGDGGKERTQEEKEYTEAFRATVDVRTLELDLASFSSVLKFAAALRDQVPYVSHLVFNAGVASFERIDWFLCLKQFLTDPGTLITAPTYYTQHVGERSADNLGWVWQSNVFGHFVLFRELEKSGLLTASPLKNSPKVIWSSSLEASPKFYDAEDWQLFKTGHSYESAKYQIDLIATNLDLHAQTQGQGQGPAQGQAEGQGGQGKVVRHFVSEPGVCSTGISSALVGPFLDRVKVWSFYLARIFGSQHHPILPFKSAIAAVHLVIMPLLFLPLFLPLDADPGQPAQPVRFGAHTDRWGIERVDVTPVKEWEAHQDEGRRLVERCDRLYEEMKREEGEPVRSETASEKM